MNRSNCDCNAWFGHKDDCTEVIVTKRIQSGYYDRTMKCEYVSAHALKRATERIGISDRNVLMEMATEALRNGFHRVAKPGVCLYNGIAYAFNREKRVLMSIWRIP